MLYRSRERQRSRQRPRPPAQHGTTTGALRWRARASDSVGTAAADKICTLDVYDDTRRASAWNAGASSRHGHTARPPVGLLDRNKAATMKKFTSLLHKSKGESPYNSTAPAALCKPWHAR